MLAALLLAGSAGAQVPDETGTHARQLFDEGRALLGEQQYDAACAKFEESLRLDAGGGTLLNLALCNELRGKTATAFAQFDEGLRWAHRDGRADREQLAEEHLAALRSRLSTLRIVVEPSARARGLSVRRDGIEIGQVSYGEPIPVDPGEHVVEVSAPGRVSRRFVETVGPDGDQREVRIGALADASPAPVVDAPIQRPAPSAPAPAPADRGSRGGTTQRWLGAGIGGIGVVGIGVGAYFGLRAMSLDQDSQDACPNYDASAHTSGSGCDPSAFGTSRDAAHAANLSTAFMVGGAVVTGIGAYLFFSAPSDSGPRAAVGLGPNGAQIRGRF
jgi:hypothetical protein